MNLYLDAAIAVGLLCTVAAVAPLTVVFPPKPISASHQSN